VTKSKSRLLPLLSLGLLLLSFECSAAGRTSIFVATDSKTQAEIGADIGRFIAAPAAVRLGIVKALGPADILVNQAEEASWSLAILPSDALHAYLELAAQGNADANQMLASARAIAPLFRSELYFIVRQDSDYFSLHDIRDARINVGLKSGTTALSVAMVYRRLFDQAIPDAKISNMKHEDALVNLISEKKIDVVALVGEQPFKLLADMKPEARQYVRLLRFEPNHPSSRAVLGVYSPATLLSSSYPNLLTEDLLGISVTQQLVFSRRRIADTDPTLTRFIRSWCANSGKMKTEGNSKWRPRADSTNNGDDSKSLQLPSVDFAPCEQKPKPASLCNQELRVLGLCL
jgi:uncharacterized protein